MAIPYLLDPNNRPGAQLFASPSAYTGGVLNAVTPLPAQRPDPMLPNSMAAQGGIIQVPEEKPGLLGRIGRGLANPAINQRLSALGAELLANSGYQAIPMTTGAGLGRGLMAMNQAGQAYDQMIGSQAAAKYNQAIQNRKEGREERRLSLEEQKIQKDAQDEAEKPWSTDFANQVDLEANRMIRLNPGLDPEEARQEAAYNIRTESIRSAEKRAGTAAERGKEEGAEDKRFKLAQQYRNEKRELGAYGSKLDQAVSLLTDKSGSVSDIAIVNTFQKLIDEGAVVREGDVALLSTTSGLRGQLQSILDNARGTGKLAPETRQQMIETIRTLRGAYNDRLDGLTADFAEQADLSGIDPDKVIGGRARGAGELRPVPGVPGYAPQPQNKPAGGRKPLPKF